MGRQSPEAITWKPFESSRGWGMVTASRKLPPFTFERCGCECGPIMRNTVFERRWPLLVIAAQFFGGLRLNAITLFLMNPQGSCFFRTIARSQGFRITYGDWGLEGNACIR